MSNRQAQFRTWITFEKPVLKTDALNFFADAVATKKTGLLIKSKASYSGYLLNGRCYPGIHMEQGIPTWTSRDNGGSSPYDMPVLLFHDQKLPAIGRVISASYHRLAKTSDFFNDWKNPARGLELGSGYTLLQMAIKDKEAQEKFLDGRFATFSTSFSSPYAGCSICERNLMEENCDHVIGEVYDLEDGTKRECFMVTGAQFNREVSVVNTPAQPWAIAEEMEMSDAKAALHDLNFDSSKLAKQFEFNKGLIRVQAAPILAVFDEDGNSTVLTLREGERDAIPNRGSGGVKLPVQIQVPDLNTNTVPAATLDKTELGDVDDVTAARRLIGRFKTDAETKARIMSEIDREAAKLCGSTKRDAGQEPENHEDIQMSIPATPAASGSQAPATPASAPAATNEDTVKVLTESLKNEQNRNRELQSAFDTAKADAAALTTSLTDAKSKLHRTQCDHLALLRTLNGEKPAGYKLDDGEGLKAYVDGELLKRTPDSISDAIRDEMGKLESKLPALKGLGAFVQDRTQARDAGANTRRVDPNSTGDASTSPAARPATTAKSIV